MSQGTPQGLLGSVQRAAACLRVFAVEIAALVFVLAWLFAGVPYVCTLFAGSAVLAFAAGCALGLLAWVTNRRFARRFPSTLASVLYKTALLFLMGALVFVDALVSHRLTGASLLAVAFASGALAAAGTATVSLAWCTALTPRAASDVEFVGATALLVNVLFATVVAFVPQASLGAVVACPILAWTLLVATRNEALARDAVPQPLSPPPLTPGQVDRSCGSCRFAHGPIPLLLSMALAFLALGYLGELGPRGIEASVPKLRLVEALLTCVFMLAAIVLFRSHSRRVDLPAALPWVTALVVVAQLLRAVGLAWPSLFGSAVFTAALALSTYSTLTLVTGGFGASPRCACTRVARPDVALAAAVGGYVLGCTAAHVVPLASATAVLVLSVAATLLLAAVSLYLSRGTKKAAARLP